MLRRATHSSTKGFWIVRYSFAQGRQSYRRQCPLVFSNRRPFSAISSSNNNKDNNKKKSDTIEDHGNVPSKTTTTATAATAAPVSTDSLRRLWEVSRPEWKRITLSAATLGVTSSVTLLLPYASGTVIDYTIIQHSGSEGGASPMLLASGLFGLSALAGGGVYLRTLWLAQAGNRIVARLRQQLYERILQQESAYFDNPETTTGDLLSRLTADAQMVQSAVTTQAVSGLRGIVMSVGSAGMLLYTSPTLAAISCGTLPPIFILTRHLGRKLSKQQEQVQELLGDATTLAEQSLTSVMTVKQSVAEDFESVRYRNAIAAAHSKAMEIAHWQAQLEAGAHIAGNAAILGVLGYGGTLVLNNSLSAGDLTGFVMYSLLLAGNLSGLTSVYSDSVRAVAASSRIFEILDRQPKIPSGKQQHSQKQKSLSTDQDGGGDDDDDDPLLPIDYNTKVAVSSTPPSRSNLKATHGSAAATASIEILGLDFRYPARPDVDVLKDFTLTVLLGEVVALVGGSGSGKSTVGSLLTRMYDPNVASSPSSSIRINGKCIREYDPKELRHMVGIVSQDPVLFRGSIRDNIAYGEWGNLTEEDVVEAARKAHVLDFAEGFPDGLDTMVGSRGMQLSGGQRQRIALARALAKNPPILILDEATSALDAQSEHYVQKALQELFEEENTGRTIISIAHRLSTIRHADRVAVIENGSIVQTGTFDKLTTTDGPFRTLMKTQLVGDVNA